MENGKIPKRHCYDIMSHSCSGRWKVSKALLIFVFVYKTFMWKQQILTTIFRVSHFKFIDKTFVFFCLSIFSKLFTKRNWPKDQQHIECFEVDLLKKTYKMSTHLSDEKKMRSSWCRCSSRVRSSIVFTALVILGISFNAVNGQPVQKTQGAEVSFFFILHIFV